MSSRLLYTSFLLLVCLWPLSSGAQAVRTFGEVIDTGARTTIKNDVYIIVEASTYTPTFYKGRPEPTPGNALHLIAITNNINSAGLSYQWQVGNSYFRTDTPRLSINADTAKRLLVKVSVLNSANTTIAQATEYIQLSDPDLVFYEHNPLRAQSRVAIGDEYTLIGDEATIYAEPYFVGSWNNTIANWRIDGVEQTSVTPFQLTLLRPETEVSSVPVTLSTYNTLRLSERVENGFTLNFGI